VESRATVIGEFPRSVFVDKPCERNNNVGVVVDEMMVEVRKSEKGLNVLNFLWFQPVGNGLNFLCGHGESVGRETETKVLGGGGMELTFLWLGEEIVLLEMLEDFVDVFLMGLEVLREICEDTIDESLESHGSICQAEGHDIPLEGMILHAERGFPFITFCNADQVVHVAEINLRVDLGLARGIKEIRDKGKWIAVLLSQLVLSLVIDAKVERTILFANK
ncbi:hypothetical protein SCLCIDRAFT_118487, partial [Scleroderma citrinum Foug A]